MMYKLNKQIWNERVHNTWIWLEMFVVSVVLWYVIDILYVSYALYSEPKGHNIEHVYQIMTDILLPSNPEYVPYEVSHRSSGEDVIEIAERLRQRQDIEAVSISLMASPYYNNYNYDMFQVDSTYNHTFFVREADPEFLKVFQCQCTDGTPIDDVVEALKANPNNVAISAKFLPDSIHLGIDSELYNPNRRMTTPIKGIIVPFKQTDHNEVPFDAMFIPVTHKDIKGLSESFSRILDISVRVKPEMEAGFCERILADANEHYRVGNRFIKTVRPLEFFRQNIEHDSFNNIRNQICICAFLLLNIFFGLLGTFWIRTQQRRKETALHIVIGSSHQIAFKRLILEGLFILTIATIPAIAIDATIATNGLTKVYQGETFVWSRYLVTTGITFGCMCLIAIIGIAIPALQSRKIELTTVLQDN